MDSVNEKSTAYIDVSFEDATGAPAVPSTVAYTVIDEASGTVIRNNGTVAAASSVVITLNNSDNTILDNTNAAEIRVVTVTATYGSGDTLNKVFKYELVNLQAIT